MKVLSLFNGISCGRLALERAGIKVSRYVSYETDEFANSVAKKHFPNDEYNGDVCTANFTQYEGFDYVIGGSPCQDLSTAGTKKGLNGDRSKLFYEFIRALKEITPKYYFLENTAYMTKENQDRITSIMGGGAPVLLDSNLVSAQDRKRLYWTNMPCIVQPQDEGLTLKDIMQAESDKQYYQIFNRMQAKALGTLAHHKTWSNVRGLNQKSKTLTCGQSITNSGATNVKYSDTSYYKLTPLECERLQTLPDNYTQGLSDTQRYKCVGNGWTVDIIAHILRFSKTAGSSR